MKKKKSIGMKAKAPEKRCNDIKCPFHGNLKLRGKTIIGTVVSDKMHNTVNVEWIRRILLPKYERYAKKRSRVKAHNPECINAAEGDMVKIAECRPLSKTKNFCIIENLGKAKGYAERKAALQESKVKEKKEEEENDKEK
jgi:small subunit ribosomal protein S17